MLTWFGLLMALLVGGAIGVFYFGGLWWTVRRLPEASVPAVLVTVSFMLRTAVAVTAFYIIAADWVRLVTAVVGFLLARFILIRQWGPGNKDGH